MKNLISIVTLCVIFLCTIPLQAQIGDLKKGVSKVKAKTTKEDTQSKEETKPDSKEKTQENNNSKATTTTTTTSSEKEPDFSELERQKMEWSSFFDGLQKKWSTLSYEEYKTKKTEYEQFYGIFAPAYKKNNSKDHSDTYTQGLIKKIDAYYTETVSEEQMTALKNRVKRSFDENDWTVYPSDRINDIEIAEKEITSIKVFLIKPDPALSEYEKTLTDQKAKIIAYVEGGGLAKRDAEMEKRNVEKRILHKAGMSDANVNATVNSKIDKARYGTPLKVVITSTSWEIERNDFGQPKLKFVKVDIATKKSDNKCYYIKGSVAQKHEGGGSYGAKYLNIYYTEGEMNCNNVNK